MKFIWEFFADPLRRAEQERRAYLDSLPAGRIDWHVPMVLIATAVLMTFRNGYYALDYGHALTLLKSLRGYLPPAGALFETLVDPLNSGLARQVYWALWQCLLYVIVPVAIVKVVLRRPLADYGLKLRGMASCWWAYLAMYLVMLPAVLIISTTESFQHTYPFYKPTPMMLTIDGVIEPSSEIPATYWPRFRIWQIFYAVQFISLEFFFRGFMLHGLRRPLGAYAIFVMTVPYCMIHFGKPLPETLGAIGAGVILGFMSLKTRSIWMGAALHIGVAVTMDLAALAQR